MDIQDILWKRVCIGDTVRLMDPSGREFPLNNRTVRVTDRVKRYGTGSSDLIRSVITDGGENPFPFVNCEPGKENHLAFAGHFIAQILKHPKGATQMSVHHAHYMPKLKRTMHTKKRGVLFGPFDAVLYDTICTIPHLSMTTSIDVVRAHALYKRTRAGLIEVDNPFWHLRDQGAPAQAWATMEGWVRVNRKAFRRWILQNINRMQFTRAELDRLEDERNREMEEDYWRDFDADLDFERNHEPDPEIEAMFDQDDKEAAADYAAGHAFLDEQERLRKMNEEAHGDDRSERYSVQSLLGEDADPRRQGPKTIGDLITINQMGTFLEEFKDSSIPPEKIDWAREVLRRVKLSTLYPNDVEQMGLLGAKIDEYDRIYGEREIKDEHL